jgi:beta-glucosidase
MESTQTLPCVLNRESTLREWNEDPRGAEALKELMEQMTTAMGDIDELDMETNSFFDNTPLEALLGFFGGDAETTPAEIINGLLKQIGMIE